MKQIEQEYPIEPTDSFIINGEIIKPGVYVGCAYVPNPSSELVLIRFIRTDLQTATYDMQKTLVWIPYVVCLEPEPPQPPALSMITQEQHQPDLKAILRGDKMHPDFGRYTLPHSLS